MSQRQNILVCVSFVFFLALGLSISNMASADTLYGIVYSGSNEGYLIEIDTASGDATPLIDTELDMPCVLTYNSRSNNLITSNCFGYPPQGFTIDLETGDVSLFSDLLSPNRELAYRLTDNVLYASDPGVGTSLLIKLNPENGEWIEDVGIINKGPVTGLSVDPTDDDTLYGIGLHGGNQWLFTVTTVPGPPPRETNIVQVDSGEPVLSGLSIDSNGALYVTDGESLLTIDRTNGNVTEIGPFGSDIGFVSDIAFIPREPDLVGVYPYRVKYIPLLPRLADLVRDGYPWCPPGFPGCPGNRLSINIEMKDLPQHMVLLGKSIQEITRTRSDTKLFWMALKELKEIVKEVPLGGNFDEGLRKQLINSIDSAIKQEPKITSSAFLALPILIRSVNAIDLDWRLPELKKQEIQKGKYVDIDLGGMVRAGFRDVIKPGEITLNIKSEYVAYPISSKFSTSWPYFSYIIDFDGELGPQGFIDLEFYIKPLRFKNQVTAIRVLQLVNDGLIDVTTGRDLSRGTVMARTDRPGSFIIVGKD